MKAFYVDIYKMEDLIKAKGWSNTYFAKKFHKSRSWITDMKKGKGLPDDNTLQAIADTLDTTVDYLTDKTDEKNKKLVNEDEELTEYLQELKTRPEMRMMFQLAKGATKEDVEKAVKIIEAFLKK
jgi:transcriptional regulator with XRE-family HTH domain